MMHNSSLGPTFLDSVAFPESKCPAPSRRKRTTIMDVSTSLGKNHSSKLPKYYIFSHLLPHMLSKMFVVGVSLTFTIVVFAMLCISGKIKVT